MSSKEDQIEFNVLIIDKKLREYKENEDYEEKECKFSFAKKNEKDQSTDQKKKYYSLIKESGSEYHGILSSDLVRQYLGFYKYSDSSSYVGEWKENKKDGYGIYRYKKKDDDKKEEMYIGQWVEDLKCGNGIYLQKSKESEEGFEYDALIGEFGKLSKNEEFEEGIRIKKYSNNKLMYKGKVNEEGKKNDEEGLYLENDKGFYGKIENDDIIEGRMVILSKKQNDEWTISNSFNKGKGEIEFSQEDDNEKDDIVLTAIKNFYAIYSNKHIEQLYKCCKNIIELMENYENLKKQSLDKIEDKKNELIKKVEEIINISNKISNKIKVD